MLRRSCCLVILLGALLPAALPAQQRPVFSPPKPSSRPAQPADPATGEGGQERGQPAARAKAEKRPALRPIDELFERLKDWPAKRARTAALALAGLEDSNLEERLIQGLTDLDWRIQVGAASALAERGTLAALPTLRQVIDPEGNRRALKPMLQALRRLDPKDSPADLLTLMAHARGRVRSAAQAELPERLDARFEPAVRALVASRRAPVRREGLRVLATIPGRAFDEALYEALSDPDPGVARVVAQHLGRIGGPEERERLLQIATEGEGRSSAYAILGLTWSEGSTGRVSLPIASDHPLRQRLEKMLASGDLFRSAVGAIGLSGLAHARSDERLEELADVWLMPSLLNAVAGGRYFIDYSSVSELCWQRIRLLTGQDFGADGPRWRAWWGANAEGFQARRRLQELGAGQLERAIISLRVRGEERSRRIVFAGPGASLGETSRALRLDAASSGAVLRAFAESDFFGTGAPENQASSTNALQVVIGEDRTSHEVSFGQDPPEGLTALVATLTQLEKTLAWQRFAPAERRTDPSWIAEEGNRLAAMPSGPARHNRIRKLALDAWPRLDEADRSSAAMLLVEASPGWWADRVARVSGMLEGAAAPDAAERRLLMAWSGSPSAELRQTSLSRLARLPVGARRDSLAAWFAAAQVDSVMEALEHSDALVREAAALALGGRREATAERQQRLRAVLADENAGVREAALEALIQIGGPQARGLLEQLMEGADLRQSRRAAVGLGQVAGAEAVPILMARWRQGDPLARAAAIEGLTAAGGLEGANALEAIVYAAKDDLEVTRALDAILRVGPPAAPVLETLLGKDLGEGLRSRLLSGLIEALGEEAAGERALALATRARAAEQLPLARQAETVAARAGRLEVIPILLARIAAPEGDRTAELALEELTFRREVGASPTLRAAAWRKWSAAYQERFAAGDLQRLRQELFVAGAAEAGVELDAAVAHLKAEALPNSELRRLIELLGLGNRPLRNQADRLLRRHLEGKSEWGKLPENPTIPELLERSARYEEALLSRY